jgi:hypothetical protein
VGPETKCVKDLKKMWPGLPGRPEALKKGGLLTKLLTVPVELGTVNDT